MILFVVEQLLLTDEEKAEMQTICEAGSDTGEVLSFQVYIISPIISYHVISYHITSHLII